MYVLRDVFAENKVDFVKCCVEYDLLTAFHTLSLLHFPLLHFPPLLSTPAFSTPAFSTPAFSAPPNAHPTHILRVTLQRRLKSPRCLLVADSQHVQPASQHRTMEYCHSETFSMSCPSFDQVIIIRRAEYGRMRVGRCVHDSAYVGCRISVLSQLDRLCSGRPSCHVALPNPALNAVDPCRVSSVKSYLQVVADCQKGTTVAYTAPSLIITMMSNI